MSTITLDHGSLRVRTPYNTELVAAIKSLPVAQRKYDPNSKSWLVDTQHGQMVVSWIADYLGEMVMLPQAASIAQANITEIFEVRYIAMTKDHGTTERSAFGWISGEWSIVFPENILRSWFDQSATPLDEGNLYAVLSVSQLATPDVIKQNYRRMARQWHPDVCHEPNATEQFRAIQHAYEILSDALKRAKYDAGLKFQAMTQPAKRDYQLDNGYRSPLRCGLIMAEGHYALGRFVVSKIQQWEDITNQRGQTLVTSWRAGADTFSEAWV